MLQKLSQSSQRLHKVHKIKILETLRFSKLTFNNYLKNSVNSVKKLRALCVTNHPNFFLRSQKKIQPKSPKIARGVNKLNHCQFVFSSSILRLSRRRDSIFLFLNSIKLESSRSQSRQFLKNCSFPYCCLLYTSRCV